MTDKPIELTCSETLKGLFIKYKDDRIDKRGKIHREFYGNGKIKKQCYKTSDGEILYCRQWTRSGRELK